MAELITSALVSDMNGKLGMSVIYRRNGKLVQRTKGTISKPRTPSQISCGQAWQALRIQWGSLTDAQRQSWRFAAAQIFFTNNLGSKFHPDGYQLYLKCNTNLKYCGLSYINSFIMPVDAVQLTGIKFQDNFDITFTGFTTDLNLYYLIYASKPLSQGITNGKKYLRFIGFIPPSTTNLFNINTLYLALFPAPLTGERIFIMLKPVDKHSGFNGLNISCNSIYNGSVLIPTPALSFSISF
jgi:hypothetical protein